MSSVYLIFKFDLNEILSIGKKIVIPLAPTYVCFAYCLFGNKVFIGTANSKKNLKCKL